MLQGGKSEGRCQKNSNLIQSHLGELYIRIVNYLATYSPEVQNPNSESAGHRVNLTLKGEE